MAPDMLLGLDKARKEELHNDAVDAMKLGFLGVPSKPILIGADFGCGKSLSSVMIMDMTNHKVVHYSKDAIIPVDYNNNMNISSNNHFGIVPPPAEFYAKVCLTHKMARQFRKTRRELGLKKPRLPRKIKKKLKLKLIREFGYEESE